MDLATADRAAGDLLRELADGHEPHPILRALLIDALQEDRRRGSARSAGPDRRRTDRSKVTDWLDKIVGSDDPRAQRFAELSRAFERN